MSYTPATLTALRTLWTSKGGVFLGCVGSITTHCGGYHLGRDRIFGSCACKPNGVCQVGRGANDYSVQLPRDKAGLSNAAMAIDLGPISGHPLAHDDLGKWLTKECQKSIPDTLDIRAVQWETLRYDKTHGITSAPYVHDVNEHGHVHIEWYRDSEGRPKTSAVGRFLAVYLQVKKTIACSGGYLWDGPSATGTKLAALPAGTVCVVLATVTGGAWSFTCNGVQKDGTAWYKVTALGQTGYVATGRFG